MKKQTQLLIIHGGMTFKNKKEYKEYLMTREVSLEPRIKWSDEYLTKALGKHFQIIRPRMPLPEDAKYADWKIWFERYIPHLNDGVILIGNSLGGIFLAKYLSENIFPKKIAAAYLICAPFDNTIEGEDLVGGFKLGSDLSLLEKNAKKLYMMFSEDDAVVPVSHAKKYEKKLPHVQIIIYKSKNGHFKISTFPEILKMIKVDAQA